MLLNEMRVQAEGGGGGHSGDSGADQQQQSSETAAPGRFTIAYRDSKMLMTSLNAVERALWTRKLQEACQQCLAMERAVLQRQRSSNFFFLSSCVPLYLFL